MRTTAGPRVSTLAVAAALLCGGVAGEAASWHVVCDTRSNTVVVTERVDEGVQRVMMGPLPSRRTAEIWLSESCPGRYCDDWGQCAEAPAAPDARGTGGGWVAGEVTSVTLSAPTGVEPAPTGPTNRVGPVGAAGPGAADLSSLTNNARAAVEACNFHAALMTADHMTNFDPEHPWLAANHQRLRDLALRQRATEDAVWQASSYLSSGDYKRARKLASAAADQAVSCQSRAVSELLRGIDAAIEHNRQMRAADNRRAAAAMLPGLIDLANAVSAHHYGSAPSTSGTSYGGSTAPNWSASTPAVNAPDSCAFKYEYRNVWNVEPVCTCPGYRFDASQHRCVK